MRGAVITVLHSKIFGERYLVKDIYGNVVREGEK